MKLHFLALGTALATASALASTVALAASHQPAVGSGNVANIQPPPWHPAETPCVVKLYRGATFGANNVNFNYTPPAACPGPWAKVILSVNVSLDAGIQYDRSGTIWLAGVPLWFGTTAEPDPKLGPSWNFQRDVTDYTSLFESAQTGFVLIANYTNSTDTSIITSTGELLFYPATTQYPAPTVPDMVIPLAAPGGGTVALNTGTDTVVIDQTLPTNIKAAALDVYLQGQSNDEFWYTCVPTSLSSELQSCPGGAYREGEISIDGTPAGVAPVYPWIFTGGIDPYLWAPIPGVQTLSFDPFRVPLSPFAGVLSNGATHQIALSLYDADSYFSVAGALMLYLDSGTTQVTGSVTTNTLAAPSPVVTNTIQTTNGNISGAVTTTSLRDFSIVGTAVTSAGTVQNTVNQTGNFTNAQKFDITSSKYVQLISQNTLTTVQTSATTSAGSTSTLDTYTYPLTVDIKLLFETSGDILQYATIAQSLQANKIAFTNGSETETGSSANSINTTDTLRLNSSFNILGHRDQASAANLSFYNENVPCFQRYLAAADNILTAAKTGCK
jgi:Peptide N-acetyl-beta-D-glucosaminyl asparaginase amidase A